MVVDLVGVAADDLKRSEGAELGMADLDVSRCLGGGRGPCLRRGPQHSRRGGLQGREAVRDGLVGDRTERAQISSLAHSQIDQPRKH
jgi:hypothetical protein